MILYGFWIIFYQLRERDVDFFGCFTITYFGVILIDFFVHRSGRSPIFWIGFHRLRERDVDSSDADPLLKNE